jgi:hypothetical protein
MEASMDRPEPEVRFQETLDRSTRLRLGAAAAAVLVGVFGVAVALAASPTPTPSGGAAATPTPSSSAPAEQKSPSTNGMPFMGHGFGMFGLGGRGSIAVGPGVAGVAGPITISGIDGSKVSLKTADGWTRTITVDSSVTITRAGATASLSDLKVGDEVRIAQTRNSDGTYTVTAIQIVLPTVVGEVTAKGSDTITIKRLDGTTETIHVSSSTTYSVADKTTASLTDITVGMTIIAQGTARSDGSLDALAVRGGGVRGMYPGKGPSFGWPFGPKPNASPNASTAPG